MPCDGFPPIWELKGATTLKSDHLSKLLILKVHSSFGNAGIDVMNFHFMLRPDCHTIPVQLFVCSCYNVGPRAPSNASALPKEKRLLLRAGKVIFFLHLSAHVCLVIIK